MVNRRCLELAVKAPKIQRAYPPFFPQKYIKMIYVQKTKMGFLGISMQSQKAGTWSMSSLIPRREDIIPRWSQLLTPLFDQGK